MKIQVFREIFTENSTIGRLEIDGRAYCFTLEDKVRSDDETHVDGATAIPAGIYQVQLRKDGSFYSILKSRLKGIGQERGTLHIYNIDGVVYPKWYDKPGVQADDFVLIHPGNVPADTRGCLLVGLSHGIDSLSGGSSTPAYVVLYPVVADAIERGEAVTIEFINARG